LAAVGKFVRNRHHNDVQGVYLLITVINHVTRIRVQEQSVHSPSAGPRPETFQHTQFRFDSTFLFGNLRLVAGWRPNVVVSVFDFRQVLNNLLLRLYTQQNE
jgi:hypothetical protein